MSSCASKMRPGEARRGPPVTADMRAAEASTTCMRCHACASRMSAAASVSFQKVLLKASLRGRLATPARHTRHPNLSHQHLHLHRHRHRHVHHASLVSSRAVGMTALRHLPQRAKSARWQAGPGAHLRHSSRRRGRMGCGGKASATAAVGRGGAAARCGTAVSPASLTAHKNTHTHAYTMSSITSLWAPSKA